MANEIHMAFPAACATTPSIEKMPAPTMPPMPMDTAATRPISPEPRTSSLWSVEGGGGPEVAIQFTQSRAVAANSTAIPDSYWYSPKPINDKLLRRQQLSP